MDNSKTIMKKVLRGDKPSRTPVAILDGYVWMLRRAGLSFLDFFRMSSMEAAKLLADGYRTLGSDIVQTNAHLMYLVFEEMGGAVKYSAMGEAPEVEKRPLSSIDEIEDFSADTVWNAVSQRPEFCHAMEVTRHLVAAVGDDKLPIAMSYAPFSLAGMLMGVQEFMEAIFDEEASVATLLDFSTDIVTRFLQAHVDAGAEAIFIADPVASGDLISPDTFAEYSLPRIKAVTATFKEQGLPAMLHICGNTEKRLVPLRGSGIAAFSMDSIDLDTALSLVDGDYTIMGNLSPSAVLLEKSSHDVGCLCRSLIATANGNGRFVLMPGCDLSPITDLANIEAMVEAAHTS